MLEDINPHFSVHPSVVYQLGESLISDEVQALIELVKNCYDADATYAKVIIDTNGVLDVDGARYPSEGGRIIVQDDGHGMNLDEITSGWLTISNRKKRELKQAKRTTPAGRTPLGDKGLGRLGVQRLGNKLEIFTKAEGDTGYHFAFSWLDFESAPNLEKVKIHLAEINYPPKHGTKVVVSDLREPETWRGRIPIKRLEKELSRMISPYKQIRNFTVMVEVDGKSLELLEVSDRIREIAPVRYSLSFDGTQIVIQGRARLDHFRPSNSKEADMFAAIAESDDGNAFFEYLSKQDKSRTIRLTRSRSKGWYVEYQWRRPLADLDKVQQIDGCPANPGPFLGEIDSFDLSQSAFKNQSFFDGASEYRSHIKELSGIRVYRDGFAIRVSHDWLNLGGEWTSGSSYFGLKPNNTLGYIALSARENMALEETTDREGFKDSTHYRNFYGLLMEFKSFTNLAHEFFGRSWAEYRKSRNEISARVDSRSTVEDISSAIKIGLAEAPQHRDSLDVFRARITASASASKAIVLRLKNTNEMTPQLRDKLAGTLTDLEPLLDEANDVIARLIVYLDKMDSLQGMGQVLDDRVEGLRRQMDEMYETVALGLTAEALSHEVFNVADQLAKQAKSVQVTLRRKNINERSILAFVEYVHSAVTALRKQMSFLSSSLRYVREQRHKINLGDFFTELVDLYFDRLRKSHIKINVLRNDDEAFTIFMNRGKLTQVIDNLILNSEYWLKEEIAQGRLSEGTITLHLSRPFVCVFDDGSGIDPSVEHALFEPFVSAKKQGRGLGLFIVKQLLASEGCSIGIVPERNQRKRLYKFQIDLRGALHE